jgi:hypothetical protein
MTKATAANAGQASRLPRERLLRKERKQFAVGSADGGRRDARPTYLELVPRTRVRGTFVGNFVGNFVEMRAN